MSNTLKIFITALVIVFLGLSFYLVYNNEVFNGESAQSDIQDSKELYAKLKHFTSSGGMKFYYYDIDKGEIMNNSNGNAWFWGGVFTDEESIDNFANYIKENEDSVFKITGTHDSDDCDYLEGFCFENINIEKIERLK